MCSAKNSLVTKQYWAYVPPVDHCFQKLISFFLFSLFVVESGCSNSDLTAAKFEAAFRTPLRLTVKTLPPDTP